MDSAVVDPELVRYATKKPQRKIPCGESFDEFRIRIFTALRGILRRFTTDMLGIVTHNTVERLIRAWQAAGSPTDFVVDPKVLFDRSERTGNAEILEIDREKLYAESFI
jgi:broad specificity phosphatase PhoE